MASKDVEALQRRVDSLEDIVWALVAAVGQKVYIRGVQNQMVAHMKEFRDE